MVPPQGVVDTMIGGVRPQPGYIPTREEFAARGNWIGNGALWISLPVDGTLLVRQEDPPWVQHPSQPWGTKLWTIPLKAGPPKITAHRLDGHGSFVGTATDSNIGSGVYFSEPGCWEIQYDVAGEALRFVVRVVAETR
jgi:hypothetical protein